MPVMTDAHFPTIVDIAKSILDDATAIQQHLETTGQPQPSFDSEYNARELSLSRSLEARRNDVFAAIDQLRDLLLGPAALLQSRGTSVRINPFLIFRSPAARLLGR